MTNRIHERARQVRTTKRIQFVFVLAIYQACLAVRYLDVEAYLVANDKVFSWASILSPIHVSIMLFLSTLCCVIVLITKRGANLAFASSMLSFSALALLWIGSLIFGGYWTSWPTVMMYLSFAGIVWFAAGVVDAPKKVVVHGSVAE